MNDNNIKMSNLEILQGSHADAERRRIAFARAFGAMGEQRQPESKAEKVKEELRMEQSIGQRTRDSFQGNYSSGSSSSREVTARPTTRGGQEETAD